MMRTSAAVGLIASSLLFGTASSPGADLEQQFLSPPDEAKPLTWWHWIDGNVTKTGITHDLEAMKRAGLGGCYLFSIGGFFPQGPVQFGTPEWYDVLKYTVSEAERLGLKFGVHNCDGWSESGGPWITPETSMKELTHSTLDVAGPQQLDTTLPQPPSKENFYRDIAVLAFPLPQGHRLNGPGTALTGSIDQASLKALSDGEPSTRASFPPSPSGHRIELALPQPAILRSLILYNVNGYAGEEDCPVLLEASLDGKSWHPAGEASLAWDTANGEKPITIAFDELKARFLRISFTNNWELQVGELELSDAARLHFAEAKAGWLRCRGHGGETRNLARYPGPDRQRVIPPAYVLPREKVRVLSSQVAADGHLSWKVPPGHWRIIRVGYTSNGRSNKPATTAGRGLECDKLDAKVVRFHLEQYVGRLAKLFGPATGKTFAAVETDSWECDVQNWTGGLEKRFQSRAGFDLIPWMPLLLEGWIMESADSSERVLWDWRRFLADQFAENYFGEVARFLKQRGLTYVSEGSGRQMYMYDAIGYQRHGDMPMGEFWLNTGPGQGVRVDNKVAASVAHTTGKRLVASESYTASARFARWQNHPASLKPLGDRAFCAGVNQFVFHTFAHQPYDVTGPGFTMAVWGLNCNRANTWWEPGRAWMQYLARCNFLLREGRFSADVLAFLGDDVPNRIGWRDDLDPVLPKGYDFDACDSMALLQARIKNGRIVLPSGMEYRVLLLPNRTTIRPAVLQKIAALTKSGATVVGPRPTQSPSFSELGKGDRQVQRLAAELWGSCDGTSVKEHKFGKGRVFNGESFQEVFSRLNLPADFDFEAKSSDPEVLYIHRRIGEAEVYFLSNQKSRPEPITARFRVANRQPEIWNPITGATTRPARFKATSSTTELPLSLDPAGSVFVVFHNPGPARHVISATGSDVDLEFTAPGTFQARAWSPGSENIVFNDGSQKTLPRLDVPAPVALNGRWDLTFPPGLGAPATAVFDQLVSWTKRPEEGIRFFSGTATYRTQFELSADRLGHGREVWLDLGEVQVIAQVSLNGKDLGILWKPPFRVNATSALQAGRNELEIRVTNLWPNRMIGDAQLPDSMDWIKKKEALPAHWPEWVLEGKPRPDGRITFCSRKPYKKSDPLLESGLLGPVRLVSAQTFQF